MFLLGCRLLSSLDIWKSPNNECIYVNPVCVRCRSLGIERRTKRIMWQSTAIRCQWYERIRQSPGRPSTWPHYLFAVSCYLIYLNLALCALFSGYRESAFAYAISSAGVAYTVAKACSQGRILSCSCDPALNSKKQINSNEILLDEEEKNKIQMNSLSRGTRRRRPNLWKWGGCSHNLKYGIEYSKLFLDAREQGNDIQSKINRHNNQAGRKAVFKNMIIQCKCHGMSGSCQLKTCWKSAPHFHIIGNILKQQFKRAILVDQSNNNGPPLIVLKKNGKKGGKRTKWGLKPIRMPRRTRIDGQFVEWRDDRQLEKLESSLFYYQRSPNFCDQDLASDIPGKGHPSNYRMTSNLLFRFNAFAGTAGRRCNRTSTGSSDSCSSMCCGRGYHLLQEQRTMSCHCKFNWCCHVECQKCQVEEYISVCN